MSLPSDNAKLFAVLGIAEGNSDEVAILAAFSPSLSFLRSDNTWYRLDSLGKRISGSEVIEVEEDFIAVYDRYRAKNKKVSVDVVDGYRVEETDN